MILKVLVRRIRIFGFLIIQNIKFKKFISHIEFFIYLEFLITIFFFESQDVGDIDFQL